MYKYTFFSMEKQKKQPKWLFFAFVTIFLHFYSIVSMLHEVNFMLRVIYTLIV